MNMMFVSSGDTHTTNEWSANGLIMMISPYDLLRHEEDIITSQISLIISNHLAE